MTTYVIGNHVQVLQIVTADHITFEARHNTPYSSEFSEWAPWQPLDDSGRLTTWSTWCRSVAHYGGRVEQIKQSR